MRFQTRQVARESCGKSYLRVAAPVILSVATLLASSEGLAQPVRARTTPAVASAPTSRSPRRLAANPRPATAPAVRNPVVSAVPVVTPPAAVPAHAVQSTPAPVATVPESVMIGGVRFTTLQLPITMEQLETESVSYRINIPGTVVGGERFDPGHYSFVTEGVGFQAMYIIRTEGRTFGIHYRNANGGDSMLSRDVTEFENAAQAVTGQSVSRVRMYVHRSTMEVANDSCGGCMRSEPVVTIFTAVADQQTGQPSVQHTENGRTGYPTFGYTYFTQQAFVTRGYYWIVPTQ